MGGEVNNQIPFLDILLSRNEDGTLGHKVFRKKSHTDNYLHADSHHYPAQKMGVLLNLFTRAFRISNDTHIEEGIEHLKISFMNLGYSKRDINRAIQKLGSNNNNKTSTEYSATSKAYLPYIQGVTDKMAKVLANKKLEHPSNL